MKTSEKTTEIYDALLALQGEMKTIKRDKTVKVKSERRSYDFKYAPLDSIVEYITPLMQKHGLGFLQSVDKDALTTRVFHKSGEWVESNTHLNEAHANMQGFGGEVTYKRRYAISSLLGIVSDDDDDAPSFRSSPTMGSFDALPDRRKSFIADLAEIIKEKHQDGNEWGAFEDYETIADNEERIAIWSLLPANVRSNLKKLNQAKGGQK